MKSMMRKTTFREIRQSLGRYMAIFAIVALGVGFFAGLKVTKPFMTATTQDYFLNKQFYDYRLVSTLGFDRENVIAFSTMEDVRAVEGSISFDVLYEDASGNTGVIKAHSLMDNINEVEVMAGRLPENPNECVVDSSLYGEGQIGEKIKLAKDNDKEDLEKFNETEYEIVGIVQSAYYIQFERGNTSLGNGKIDGFMYLLPDGFDVDYYTEIFVKFDKDFDLYSDEYKDFIDEKEAVWKEMSGEQADLRYFNLVADAKQELTEKKAEAEEELTDAKKELDDAYEELTEGDAKIADAEKEIADGEKEIADNKIKLQDAEIEIAGNEAELLEKEQELIDGEKTWKDNDYKVSQNWNSINKSQTELDAQRTTAETGLAQIEQTLSAYPQPLDMSDPTIQFLLGKKAEAEIGLQTIAAYQAQLDAGKKELGNARTELNKAWAEIVDGKEKIEEGKQKLADAKQEVSDGWVELADAEKDLKKGKKELEEKKQELEDGWIEYKDGLKEYEEGYEEFQTEIADAEQKIADIEEPDVYVLGRDTNVGYVCFESDSDIVEDISNIFPIFFFLVAALVCVTTMNRMVEEQRTQIGVLKALGYDEKTIMFKYMFYSGSAAVGGCIFGFVFGTFVFPKVIWSAYGMMYNMISLKYVFNLPLAIISLAVSLLCSIGTTWLSCRYEFMEVAAELMRPKAPKAGKRVFLEYIPFIWRRLKFLHKVSVRNILRYKKRFLMMVIGISGCTALVLTGFGVQDSIADIATLQFTEIQNYDISVGFKNGVNEELEEKFEEKYASYIESCGYVCEKSMDFYANGQMRSVELIMAQDDEKIGGFIDLHTAKGEPIAYPKEDEIVICRKLAGTYNINVGDSIYLQDGDMNKIHVTVSAICQNYIYNYIYINADTYEKQIGEAPEFKTAFIKTPEGTDAHQAAAAIMKMTQVSSSMVNEDMVERFSGMMKSLDYVVIMIILCAAALAFIVLYNLTNINITERMREIATIKVLGFYKKETSSYVFRENTVLTFIGSLIGLGLGYFLHRFVMTEIKVDMVAFAIRIKPISYIYSIILTFVFAWIVNRIMTFKLEKINMAESLKSVD